MNRTIGTALVYIGLGGYLLVLEVVRIANYFWSYFALTTPAVFGLTCFVCSLVIALGIGLRFYSREPLRLGIVVVCAVGAFVLLIPTLVYLPYFIPYATGPYTAMDWCVAVILVGLGTVCICYSAVLIWRSRSRADPGRSKQ